MVKVWVLLIYFKLGYGGGMTSIDNIATKDECYKKQEEVSLVYKDSFGTVLKTMCIEVEKFK